MAKTGGCRWTRLGQLPYLLAAVRPRIELSAMSVSLGFEKASLELVRSVHAKFLYSDRATSPWVKLLPAGIAFPVWPCVLICGC
jgi:hypothetical protein